MNPAQAGIRLALACLLGCGGGVLYGFLRFFRPRWLSDLILGWGIFRLWLQLSFSICDGDLRMGYTLAFLLSIFVFDRTAGKLLRPLFSGFWRLIWRLLRGVYYPFGEIFKKIRKISKKIFAMRKKWVTIKWNWYSQHKKSEGGNTRV